MIIPVSQHFISRTSFIGIQKDTNKQKQPVHTSPADRGYRFGVDYMDATIYMSKMNKLKEETRQFPQDVTYREQLMSNAGLNPRKQHTIRSIIGPQEIQQILQDYDDKPEVFSVGENWENVHNGKIRANLHMHTTSSDGSLTVTELLDKAAEYANKVKRENPKTKEPFVVAITDHDTTEGISEAIKVISENPLKYENLRVILGVEITTFNNIAQNLTSSPTNTHVLVYGVDPNEFEFKEFIEKTKIKKLNLQYKMQDSANKVYEKHFGKPQFYNVKEAKQQYNTVEKNIVGIFNGMDEYFKTKAVVEEVVLKDKKLKKALEDNNIGKTSDEVMEKLSEYNAAYSNNNKVLPPETILPEFISDMTGMEEDSIKKRLEKGMQTQKFMDFRKDLKSEIAEYKVTFTPKYDYMPTFETVYQNLKGQNQVIMGIAHPIDTIKPLEKAEDKYDFLEDLYTKFKSGCKEKAKFTEAYYQSYKPGRKEFNEQPETQDFFKKAGKVFKLFRTGSADTHGLNIFVR